MKKMFNFLYGCLGSSKALISKFCQCKGKDPSFHSGFTDAALVVQMFQSRNGVGNFLSHQRASKDDDFRKLLINFELYKIPKILICLDECSKSTRLYGVTESLDLYPTLLPSHLSGTSVNRNSSLFAGTYLDRELNRLGIRNIILAGQMTPASISLTRRDAELLGYQVTVPKDLMVTGDRLDKLQYPVNGTLYGNTLFSEIKPIGAESKIRDPSIFLRVNKSL